MSTKQTEGQHAIVLVLDTSGRIVQFNRFMEHLSGYNLDDVRGRDWFDTFVPAEERECVRSLFQEAIMGTATRGNISPILTRDGTRRQIEWYDSLLRDAHGTVSGLMVFGQEVTQRLQMEAQLRQAQKLDAIGTLAGGIAHEINNPIMGIMNYAQVIKDRVGNDAELAEFCGEIIHETERVATIVRNLLSFARQERQTHSPARLCDIVDATLSLIRTVIRHDQITLTVDVPDALAPILCRSQQIQQVLIYLLTNARDALNEKYPGYHENKNVSIAARQVHEDRQAWIRVSVRDYGTGIPAHIRQRIFDPFFTTKPRDKGTGLGLAISHGIVKDHGGRLSFDDGVSEGTCVHLDLPAIET